LLSSFAKNCIKIFLKNTLFCLFYSYIVAQLFKKSNQHTLKFAQFFIIFFPVTAFASGFTVLICDKRKNTA